MDFLEKMPVELKGFLEKKGIYGINMYFSTDLNESADFHILHFVITKDFLYKIDLLAEKIQDYPLHKDDILVSEQMVFYSKLYIKREDKMIFLSCYGKQKNVNISLAERYFMKAMQGNLTEEDYQHPDVLKGTEKKCPKCQRPITSQTGTCRFCNGKKKTFFRLFKYLTNYRWQFVLVLMSLLFISLIGIATPILTGKILYNEVLTPEGRFFGCILGLVCVFMSFKLMDSFLNMFFNYLGAKVSNSLCFDMKNEIFQAMQKLSLSFYYDKETGSLMNEVVWNVNSVYNYLINTLPYCITHATKLIGILIYLFYLKPILALCLLLPIPFLFLLYWRNNHRFSYFWHHNHYRNNQMTSIISDTLEGFRIVKVFSGQEKEIHRFAQASQKVADIQIQRSLFQALIYPIFGSFPAMMGFLIWGVGGYLTIIGKMDYGELMTFTASLSLIYQPFDFFNNFIFNYTPWTLNSAKRIFEIMDAKTEIVEKENPIILENMQGNIEFKNVEFAYEVNQPVLKNINLKMKANTTLGIVGKTGAGKTTIVNLLTRLYDVNAGEILLDGVNIKDLKLTQLHQQIALISQDIYLFNGTIRDNIAYAKENASEEEIIQAAKDAHAHEFIMKLEKGYDTLIGEGNLNLSGGEKQRVSIARAVLLNPKIIIFDEATASLDTKTEQMIQNSILKLAKNRTVILIAHRLSTLKDADYLIVVDQNQIVEEGTMEELIQKNGHFAELYKVQQEGLKYIRIGE